MIKSLRKRHLQIWTIWAMLIPIGIIAAWIAVPEKVSDTLLQPESGIALPILIQSVDKDSYTANLRTTDDHSLFQLEWINKKPSTDPSSLIYKINQQEDELIGRIEARGVYYFSLANDSKNPYNFILYDIIKKQTIDSINFKTLH